ncbi:hypothetical protein Tco_1546554 [Tanacetum coccineum]
MDYDQLYTELNVGAARQVCLRAEVRMRAEHTLEKKGELEDKCDEQAALLLEKNDEITHLKSLLSLKEAEAAEAIRLGGQLAAVEATDIFKGNELRDLKEKNFALKGDKEVMSERVTSLESVAAAKDAELASISLQVSQLTSKLSSYTAFSFRGTSYKSSLEFTFELFKEQVEAMQDEQATALANRVAELDAQLLEMAAHLEEEFYPCFLTTISGWRWIMTHRLKLILFKCLQSTEYLRVLGEAIGYAINKGMQDGLRARVDHGKAGRDLSIIESYDPSAKQKYVDAVNALRTVVPLLFILKSKKDASMVDLMDSLRLEGPLAEIPGPLSSKSLIGEASTSANPAAAEAITTLSITFASSIVVPPLSVSDYQVSDAEPNNENPPTTTFEKEGADTAPK